jgi:hypothetical protein
VNVKQSFACIVALDDPPNSDRDRVTGEYNINFLTEARLLIEGDVSAISYSDVTKPKVRSSIDHTTTVF